MLKIFGISVIIANFAFILYMKRIIRNIFIVLCLSLWFAAVPAMASEDSTLTSERIENGASVSTCISGITLKVNADKIERFHIFSITGQLVKSVDVEPGVMQTVNLPKGCYIIKCSYWSKKVLVK